MEKISKEELIAFEEDIKYLYLDAKIRAPVHFCGGNEEPLIEIFKKIKEEDWVFSTHRSHYHALLKGIPKDWIKNEIIEKRSIHLNNAEYRFFTSAIVGGILPIALGTAMGIKRKKLEEKVWCFVGDMCSEMGSFHEVKKYAEKNDLPIYFVIEDNGMSVDTPTKKVWGSENGKEKIYRYEYKRKYPHHGCGQFVNF